jgi:predicted dehydrogenase
MAVCGRKGSTRARAFARENGVARAFDGIDELLGARDTWDAAVVAVPVKSTLAVLDRLVENDVPTLAEKPVAVSSEALQHLLSHKHRVIVGYNRRFYRTVSAARDFARRGPVAATLSLPERVASSTGSGIEPFFAVSVHALDIARFVLGDLHIVAVEPYRPAGRLAAVAAIARAERGDILQLIGCFDTPANFALTLDRNGERFELRPFESATLYSGMDIREPSPERPYRRHEPRVKERIELDAIDQTHKPGFVAQARALAALVRGDSVDDAARLPDAFAVLRLAEQLVLG